MKKLSIKNLIEFRGKTEKGKKRFAKALHLKEEKNDTEGGGNYWISSLSAISNTYRANNLQIIKDKISELEEKFGNTEVKLTKNMYRRNAGILYRYEDFDFSKWRPSKNLSFQKKLQNDSIITINGLQIQANPNHVFTYRKNGVDEIGAIWFVAKLNGYGRQELGMFTDILNKYLESSFPNKAINPKYCLAVDVVSGLEIDYSQIQKKDVPAILTSTINEIARLM